MQLAAQFEAPLRTQAVLAQSARIGSSSVQREKASRDRNALLMRRAYRSRSLTDFPDLPLP